MTRGVRMQLVVVGPQGARAAYTLQSDMLVGRDPSCAIVLEDERVSRQHARVERHATAELWILRDLGSRNGIVVDGQRRAIVELSAGTELEVGRYRLRVECVESHGPPTIEAPPKDRRADRARQQDAVDIAVGRERYTLDRRRWAQTDWPERAESADIAVDRVEALFRGAAMAARASSVESLLEGALGLVASIYPARSIAAYALEGESLIESLRRGAVDPAMLDAVRAANAAGVHRIAYDDQREGALLIALLATPEKRHGVLALRLAPFARPVLDDLELLAACSAQVALGLDNVRMRDQLKAENERLRARTSVGRELVGRSPVMKALRERIARIAQAESTVLVRGESGTGKELVAQAIHRGGDRAAAPFVAVNCGALPGTLLQSELFGHEKGAFTGADRTRQGVFEQADGGTLFLDEIGELPLDAQVQLLRVLETRRVTRVGATRAIAVDVRVIGATHRDLEEMVARGAFREDLYYRLNVLTIETVALRAHLQDMEELCEHVLAELVSRIGRRVRGVTADAIEELRAYHWPGNVRELRNTLERAAILSEGDSIDAHDLGRFRVGKPQSAQSIVGEPMQTMESVEAAHYARVLEHVGWNKSRAADVLGVRRQTVYDKIRLYGLEEPLARKHP